MCTFTRIYRLLGASDERLCVVEVGGGSSSDLSGAPFTSRLRGEGWTVREERRGGRTFDLPLSAPASRPPRCLLDPREKQRPN